MQCKIFHLSHFIQVSKRNFVPVVTSYSFFLSVPVLLLSPDLCIPKALKDRIFDPFFSTKGPHSTGLGLSVSYGIINRHRGTIAVYSVESKGTSFTITLPIAEKIVKEEKEKPIVGEQRKARILVIEDEEEVRNVLSAILTTGGHEVEVASGGEQGIKEFKIKEFDLDSYMYESENFSDLEGFSEPQH